MPIVHIGRGTVPALDLAICVQHGFGPHQHPAILAVVPPQPVTAFEGRAPGERLFEAQADRLHVVLVDDGRPIVFDGGRIDAEEVDHPLVRPGNVVRNPRYPEHLGHKGAEPLQFLRLTHGFALCQDQLGRLPRGDENAAHLIVGIAHRRNGEGPPVLLWAAAPI